MSEHTPGPWELDSDGHIYPEDADGSLEQDGYLPNICRVNLAWGSDAEPNARLIAAAPELLEALESLVRHDQVADEREGLPNCREVTCALEVIAKARGQ